MKFLSKVKNPDTALWTMLLIWWVVNLLQAAFTGLADDEAYYHMFSQSLALGYFDHPPMTALLVRMGSFLGGELGMRFFFTILQPLYIYIFWRVIRPESYSLNDVVRYVMICVAMPILQLYGFIAVPDGPLMLFAALFLLCYKRFTQTDRWGAAVLMGIVIGALAYSKYHGALVIFLAVLSNLKLLRNPKFYLSCFVALVVIAPHLYWQYNNDWVSFSYHLSGRNRDFRLSFVTEYILNLFAIFNPFLFPVALAAWWKTRSTTPVQRAVSAIGAGFILFFLASTVRGYVQPQWEIPATFCVIMLLYNYTSGREKLRRYTSIVCAVTLALMVLVRVEMIFNPLGIKTQIFDNEASYGKIAEAAAGRPVIFDGGYTDAAKYEFYTSGRGYAQPTVQYRTSHYQLLDDDTAMAGGPVLIENGPGELKEIVTPAGWTFRYSEVDNFIPVRKIRIETTPIPKEVSPGERITVGLKLINPYPYDYLFDGDSVCLKAVWRRLAEPLQLSVVSEFKDITLGAKSEVRAEVTIDVPDIKPKEYEMGFIVTNGSDNTWFNSKPVKVRVKKAQRSQ